MIFLFRPVQFWGHIETYVLKQTASDMIDIVKVAKISSTCKIFRKNPSKNVGLQPKCKMG